VRQTDVELAQGKRVGEVRRGLGISEQSYYRWRTEYGGLRLTFLARATRLRRRWSGESLVRISCLFPARWSDLGKSRPDRFCRIPALTSRRRVLRVRSQSQIARTRADFERFSEMSENLETGWWGGKDLNRRPTHRISREIRGLFRAIQANLRLRELGRHQFVEARATAVYTAPGQNGCDWICDAD
jgi:hypothetical protein